MEVAVDLRLDEGGTVARAHVRERFLHRQVHGERVHPVDSPARNAESRTTRRQSRLAGGLGDARRHGVPVVLDEEAQRQLPGRGQVERLQRRADVGRAVAEVGDCDSVCAGMAVRPGRTGSQRDATTDDGVRADGAGLFPLQVHRSTAAVAEAALQPADLGEAA